MYIHPDHIYFNTKTALKELAQSYIGMSFYSFDTVNLSKIANKIDSIHESCKIKLSPESISDFKKSIVEDMSNYLDDGEYTPPFIIYSNNNYIISISLTFYFTKHVKDTTFNTIFDDNTYYTIDEAYYCD